MNMPLDSGVSDKDVPELRCQGGWWSRVEPQKVLQEDRIRERSRFCSRGLWHIAGHWNVSRDPPAAQCLCAHGAVRAPWSVSETHTGTLVWSQFVPPACCWWLPVTPFPSKNSCRRHSVMEFRGSAQNTSSTAGSAGNKLLTADFSRSLC